VASEITGLALAFIAAPIMLSLATPPSAAAAQRAFDDFSFWGLYLRGAADVGCFYLRRLGADGTERT
jgi:hypothetical protein